MAKIKIIKTQLIKGKPTVIITTTERTDFVAWGSWLQSATKDIHNYVGGNFEPIHYEVGEIMQGSETPCTAADKVVKVFSASLNPQVAAYASVISANEEAEKMNEAMYAQRLLRTTRAAQVKPAVVVEVAE